MFWITGLLGLALGVAPWVFQYNNNDTAMWTSVGVGAIILLVSAYKGLAQDTQKWEYWVIGLAGIVAVAAPFVLDFTALTAAMWASLVIGILAVLISGYEVALAAPDTV
jgi:bacteriorhodopsin